jgi:hypothetical protein
MRGNTIAVVVGYRLNAVILPGRKIQGGESILLVATSVHAREHSGHVDLRGYPDQAMTQQQGIWEETDWVMHVNDEDLTDWLVP